MRNLTSEPSEGDLSEEKVQKIGVEKKSGK
jgi:hypothetical protein